MQPVYVSRFDSYDEELYHHGILGQRWGVRRFQNSDGSLTAAGKKRYSDDGENRQNGRDSNSTSSKKRPSEMTDDELRSAINRKRMEQDLENLDTPRENNSNKKTSTDKRDTSTMTDEELRNAISRLQMEATYASLTAPKTQSTQAKGKTVTQQILEKTGDAALNAYGEVAKKAFGYAYKSAFKNVVFANNPKAYKEMFNDNSNDDKKDKK